MSETNLSKESLFRAVRLNSCDPTPLYRLALFYQWDIDNIGLKESINYLRKTSRYNQMGIEGFLSLFSLKAVQNQKDGFEHQKSS